MSRRSPQLLRRQLSAPLAALSWVVLAILVCLESSSIVVLVVVEARSPPIFGSSSQQRRSSAKIMPKPKKILNDPKDAVEEFVQGLLVQFPNHLVKLQNHNVILKSAPSSYAQVQLLSGGGSGHEPSHAGWIGEGMLSGAILGGMFASPSVAAVLAAIRAASLSSLSSSGRDKSKSGRSPVLLIVKNYTGDRLNFGMACERANMEGIPCRMVVVADDCALERSKGITGARGVAGTVLVHKIAGAAAARKESLDDVVSLAREVCRRMGTLGVALDAVTVPGAAEVNDRLDDATIEIGLGIHGEAGMRQSPLLTATDLAKEMLNTIRTYGRVEEGGEESGTIIPMWSPGDDVCLLVNNLGGTSNFEMSILANAAVRLLESSEHGVTVSRVLVGSFMTSFDMHGASLTVLNLSGASTKLLECLDAATTAPAWQTCDVFAGKSPSAARPSATEVPEEIGEGASSSSSSSSNLRIENMPELASDWGWTEAGAKSALEKAATALADAEPVLTKYDTIVGDGDCGITMKRGATQVLEGGISTEHPVVMFADLADAVSASMGGTSGVLLELMFRKMSSTLMAGGGGKAKAKIDRADLAAAFQAGVDAVSFYGGATVGARTMLDALVPAAASWVNSKGTNVADAATKAREGADSTASMEQASAGRSNYLSSDTLTGTPDPGATAVAVVMEALAQQ